MITAPNAQWQFAPGCPSYEYAEGITADGEDCRVCIQRVLYSNPSQWEAFVMADDPDNTRTLADFGKGNDYDKLKKSRRAQI